MGCISSKDSITTGHKRQNSTTPHNNKKTSLSSIPSHTKNTPNGHENIDGETTTTPIHVLSPNTTTKSGGDTKTGTKRNNRLDCIQESRSATFGGITVRFAYLSQRCFYPDDKSKENQDSYSIVYPFNNNSTDAFFAVYDGHGKNGEECACFASKYLPLLLDKQLRKIDTGYPTREQTQNACVKACTLCNSRMHKDPTVDDNLSGTTAISCLIQGQRNRITVCNVGDSRAVLGQRIKRKNESSTITDQKEEFTYTYRALPLSRDQTPYRSDERKRIRATGARILSLDQIEGLEPIDSKWESDVDFGEEIDEGGDPPRVWSPHGDYPGTAFTRSFGDAIAEGLGVFAEPEMVTRVLSPNDKIIVLASDGVFEFLTNQSVIDICAKYEDPLDACNAVASLSYDLWLQYELRSDDITMICIFIDSIDDLFTSDSFRISQMDMNELKDDIAQTEKTPLPSEDSRPVRKHPSKETSKHIDSLKKQQLEKKTRSYSLDYDDCAEVVEKSQEERECISKAVSMCAIMKDLSKEKLDMVVDAMEPISVKKGEWIIRQGTIADRFYIVDDGELEVRVLPEGQEDINNDGGHVVYNYSGSRKKMLHPSFGDIALVYSVSRQASVIATSDSRLWALHKSAFRKVLVGGRTNLINVLKKISIFQQLDEDELENVIGKLQQRTFGRGQTIIEEGEVGSTFYIIASGTCDKSSTSTKVGNKKTLKADDYFGEEILNRGEMKKYKSTVITTNTTTCWVSDKNTIKAQVKQMRTQRRNSGDIISVDINKLVSFDSNV